MTFCTYQQKTQNMHETAIPMRKMLHTCLAIHGRCKFIIFLRGQTPSLSAPTLILSLMEHFEGKAKNTVKYSVKSTFCRSIQINCNWLPGNPQPSPIYIYIYIYVYLETHVSKISGAFPTYKKIRRKSTRMAQCRKHGAIPQKRRNGNSARARTAQSRAKTVQSLAKTAHSNTKI